MLQLLRLRSSAMPSLQVSTAAANDQSLLVAATGAENIDNAQNLLVAATAAENIEVFEVYPNRPVTGIGAACCS